MALTQSDIVYYGSSNMQETDSGLQGGSIDITTRPVFTDIVADDEVAISSTYTNDNQTITVYGRNAGGSIINEAIVLNGGSVVTGTSTFERILKIESSPSHSGDVYVMRSNAPTYTNIATLESGVDTIRRIFYNANANATGGADKDYYEKIFVRNNHASSNFLTVSIEEVTAATPDYVDFAVESGMNGTGAATSRLSAPTDTLIGSFDANSKALSGIDGTGDIGPGTGVGIWLHLDLNAGVSSANTTYTIRANGSTV